MERKLKRIWSIFLCITLVMGSFTGVGLITGKAPVADAASVIKLPLNIPAKLRSKQSVRKEAGKKTLLKVNKKAVALKKSKSVKILSEKVVSKKRWYQVSFSHAGKKRTGYVLASEVELSLKSKAEATVSAKKGVTVKTGAGTKKPNLLYKKKKVTIKKATKVKITKETKISGKRWYRISFTYKKKKMKGYILADKVKFIVKTKTVEDVVDPPVNQDFEQMLTTQGFPEAYKVKLRELHKKYPNWKFTAFHTGLEWKTVIDAEAVVKAGGSPKNLLSNGRSVAWKSYDSTVYNWATDAHTIYDGTYWVAASRAAVEYFMDPRNFIDERGVFQFEALEYQEGYQTIEGVKNILANTPFDNTSYTYVDDSDKTVKKSYADTFMEAARLTGVSPYHLASRVKQEVVTGTKTVSNSVTGTVSGYEGIYNFFNIGANDSKSGEAVINGLKYASSGTTYMRPWNNPYKSIVGGATYIGEKYITRTSPKLKGTKPQSIGQVNTGQQNTLYLQKFNVTPYETYGHQYMTNVEAPNSEATKVYTAYKGTLDSSSIVFNIPVYLNMPQSACPVPNGGLNPNNYLRTLKVGDSTLVSTSNAVSVGDGATSITVPTVSGASITVQARSANANAKVTIKNGSQSLDVTQKSPYSVQLNLNPGANNVTITVKAENGVTRTYRFVINRT